MKNLVLCSTFTVFWVSCFTFGQTLDRKEEAPLENPIQQNTHDARTEIPDGELSEEEKASYPETPPETIQFNSEEPPFAPMVEYGMPTAPIEKPD